jgi:hypothetical protein
MNKEDIINEIGNEICKHLPSDWSYHWEIGHSEWIRFMSKYARSCDIQVNESKIILCDVAMVNLADPDCFIKMADMLEECCTRISCRDCKYARSHPNFLQIPEGKRQQDERP